MFNTLLNKKFNKKQKDLSFVGIQTVTIKKLEWKNDFDLYTAN